jgi:hypothetical protein
MTEDGKPVLGDVFGKQDASLSIAQQACQHGFAFEERAIAQILAIMLDQVEAQRIAVRAASRRG